MQRHCTPSTRHYVVAPLQRVSRRAPSTRRSTRPFNASLDTPLQRVVLCAPSTRCLMHPFNTSFEAPLQHGVRRAPSTRHHRAHSTRLCRAPSTCCPTHPFNASSSRASSSSTHRSTCPSTCRQHAPFNALSLQRALPRVAYVPFTAMSLPPSMRRRRTPFHASSCASLQRVFARAIQLIVGMPFHVMSTRPSTALLWNRLIVACIHS
jgi:hypothetical protein